MNKVFYVQVILSVIVIVFCLVQIDKGGNTEVLWSTIAGILGYWFPSPAQNKNYNGDR